MARFKATIPGGVSLGRPNSSLWTIAERVVGHLADNHERKVFVRNDAVGYHHHVAEVGWVDGRLVITTYCADTKVTEEPPWVENLVSHIHQLTSRGES